MEDNKAKIQKIISQQILEKFLLENESKRADDEALYVTEPQPPKAETPI